MMVHWLRKHTALIKDLRSVPSIYLSQLTLTPVSMDPQPLMNTSDTCTDIYLLPHRGTHICT